MLLILNGCCVAQYAFNVCSRWNCIFHVNKIVFVQVQLLQVKSNEYPFFNAEIPWISIIVHMQSHFVSCVPIIFGILICRSIISDIKCTSSIPSGYDWQFAIWKIPKINGGVSSWENHLFLWAIYTMAMLNNQRVNPIKISLFTIVNPLLNH